MPVTISRGRSDKIVKRLAAALMEYEKQNPAAEISLYRHNSVSVRIRIIDPSFQKLDRPDRHAKVWSFLENLPDEAEGDISMLALMTPNEVANSVANVEFDNPIPSKL